MADDLQDLGSTTIWRQSINWGARPKYDYDGLGRQLIGYEGTTKQLINRSEEKPQVNEFQLLLQNKAQEKETQDEFIARKGKHARFWQLLPVNLWTLDGVTAAGATTLTVARNEFDFRGFERFYILMDNDDLITRAIDTYTTNEVNDTADIVFSTVTDRILDPDEIILFSLLLLVRLDNDELNLRYHADSVTETAVRTLELVKEYGLV